MSDGFRGSDEVNVDEVFAVRSQVMKRVPQFIHDGRFQEGPEVEFAGDCERSRIE